MRKDEQMMRYEKELEKLNRQSAEKKAMKKKAADDEKVLRQKQRKLREKMRTHQLCVRGEMLEGYLKEPELFSDDDIRLILDRIFSDPDVQKRLENALEHRRKHPFNEENSPVAGMVSDPPASVGI